MCSNAHLVLYPVNEDEYNFVGTIRNTVNSSNNKNKELLNKTLEQNDLNILFDSDPSFWPIYSSHKPALSRYKNIFYLGDAFYGFLPTMAQGASQSIESASELFQVFEKDNNNQLDIYCTNRLERVKTISKRSNFNFFAFHLSNVFFVEIRNFILRKLIYNKKFIESFLGRVFRK